MIRRLPQWDLADTEDNGEAKAEEELLQSNQMCSCRISCRSVRCSCVKAAKSCRIGGSVCLCINCDNPLNILESIGMNLDFSLSDSCLFQNVYQIPKLLNYLQRDIKLSCCNTVARVRDVIPGTVLCPNVDCNECLEFSWCRGIVCYPERNPRNHCSFCGLCCFSNGRHCFTCNRCYTVTSKCPNCPTCRGKVIPDKSVMNDDPARNALGTTKQTSKRSSKPEIILLDASLSSKSESAPEGVAESSDFSSTSFDRETENNNEINNNRATSVKTSSNDELPIETRVSSEVLFTKADTEKCEDQNCTGYFSTIIEIDGMIVKDERTFESIPETPLLN